MVDCKVYHHKNETMLKGGVTYVVELKITFNDLLTLGSTYTILNDTLNQRMLNITRTIMVYTNIVTMKVPNYCIYYVHIIS